MTVILSIDPGTEESGWCIYLTSAKVVHSCGVLPNGEISDFIRAYAESSGADHLAIEMVASYGMAVGQEVFRTIWWTGRFAQVWSEATGNLPMEVFRKDVKIHLCGTTKAKDKNIRLALIDLIGPQGNKKEPGPTYQVKSHAWSALAVALTAEHMLYGGAP